MKSRSRKLVDKSVAAMVSAIEVYNKPDFKYREETFAVLAANAWELLLKAKWLTMHGNDLKSLYVKEKRLKSNGEPYKYPKIKTTACGNPITHSLDYLVKKLSEAKDLPATVGQNLDALKEIRDSSVHFYNRDSLFALQLQEVGSASVKNYVRLLQVWFRVNLAQFNFYLMPLAFVEQPKGTRGIVLNREERNLASYIGKLGANTAHDGDYAVTVSVDVHFSRSKSTDAMKVQLTNDPNAAKVQFTDDQVLDRWPFTYDALSAECTRRYSDFSRNKKYHDLRRPLKSDQKYCHVRKLDPTNPRSLKQERYSHAVFSVFDRHYAKKNR